MVNGEYVGVYANVEQRNKQFLRNRGLYSSETKDGTWLYKVSDVDSPTLKVRQRRFVAIAEHPGGHAVEVPGQSLLNGVRRGTARPERGTRACWTNRP